jgi:hypothetical protein
MPLIALRSASPDMVGSAPPTGAPLARSLLAAVSLPNNVDGGEYQVVGTTKVKGAPDYAVSRRVRLHDQLTGLVVSEQWSVAGTGVYAFTRLRAGTFYIVAFDYTNIYNGIIATNVVSELMA